MKKEFRMVNPYKVQGKSSFWQTGVREPVKRNTNFDIFTLTDLINKDSVVCSIGSCFAQHIGKNLVARGVGFLKSSFSGDRLESFGLGNVYTTRQMCQWLEYCLDTRVWSDETLYNDKNGLYYDYLIPHLPAVQSESLAISKRILIRNEFISQLNKATVFIFTCGLTEQWSTHKGEALAVCPGTRFGEFNSNKHSFDNISYDEICEDLSNIEHLISKINSHINFIYTVSPVPLAATAENEHVLISTCFSKSKLRAAVGEHTRKSPQSMYFPSYELITHNTKDDWRFQEDMRTISNDGVSFVMHHGFGEAIAYPKQLPENPNVFKGSEVECDEELLETHNRVRKSISQSDGVFLIGDSHLGKLAAAFNDLGAPVFGGQIMNGSGFSDNKFILDDDKIFLPQENDKSREIWDITFDQLNKFKGRARIYTNIGFQSHRTIVEVANCSGTIFLSVDDFSDYFLKKHFNTIELLARLSQYGELTFIEDPNTYSIIDNYSDDPAFLKIQKLNFSIFTQFLRELSVLLKCNYRSYFHPIIREISVLPEGIQGALGADVIHGSDLYYSKLAQMLIREH